MSCFGRESEVVLPLKEGETLQLEAGKYKYIYKPSVDVTRPYNAGTTLKRLAKDPQAMGILGRYVPAYAGIAASGDLEMGANTLIEMSFNDFISYDREQLQAAIKELSELRAL